MSLEANDGFGLDDGGFALAASTAQGSDAGTSTRADRGTFATVQDAADEGSSE